MNESSSTYRDVEVADALEAIAPGATRYNVQLADIARWRIGGPAAALVEPRNPAEAANIMAAATKRSFPIVIIGETSNLLFDSAGFRGIVMRIGEKMSALSIDGTTVIAQAGVAVPTLARAVASQALTGIEHTVGIPGTLGGLVLMNGGSQRRGIGENVERVFCANATGQLFELSKNECGFAYRQSALQRMEVAILEVVLRLAGGSRRSIEHAMGSIVAERAAKFPNDHPSCGSTFLSDPGMYETIGPPGRAIEEAGLKGLRVGDAQVSAKHANFLLNLGSATSDDVLQLIALVRDEVHARTGCLMQCEVRHVSPEGAVRPADEVAVPKFGKRTTA